MKLSVSAYRAHASAHKKILDTKSTYNLNYGSTSAFHPGGSAGAGASGFQIDPPSTTAPTSFGQLGLTGESGTPGSGYYGPGGYHGTAGCHLNVGVNQQVDDASSDDANTPLHSPRSHNTSKDEDDSSNANESDCKSPSQRTKSNQRWMKLRTTVQISSAIHTKKPPLKREDSFLQRFATRQIPEAQETVEDTGSEGAGGDRAAAHRRRKRKLKQRRTVVNPDSNFYFYWLFVLTICVLYNLWTLIVRQSFPELQEMLPIFWITCDYLSDLVFLIDLAVQFRTGYLEQGLMVYNSKKLACHYLRSRAFLLDLAALCPVDLLQLRFGANPLLRCPRFLKVYRAINYYYMVESRTIWPNLWRVVNLIHILLILAHWFGCFYFLLSEAEGFQGDWVYPYRPGDYATLTRKYLGSLYWSTLTLTTIGDLPTPETNAEYVFTIVSYLIGVFIFATIVGQVGNVITNRNANRLEFERLLDGAKMYMRHHKVPSGMKRRVLRWYDYSWSRGRIQGGGDINTALGLLPDKLKTELALHVNLTVLKKVTIFQECQPEFLRDLVLKMKAYIFTPGDSICRKGEVAREMFIIADGILEVISEHGKVLTTMKAGDFFGEIGILNLDGFNKRTADVRSVGYSELFSLSREDVLNAMKDYPEAQEILQALGRKRLMELLQVKASAKHPPHHKGDHHGHGHDNKGLVGKIKSEAKGLKNVLKKSRTHRRSQESLEMHPLHPSSTAGLVHTTNGNKGTLKRMSRVTSFDNSSQEHDKKDPEPPPINPLGAGLPLLQRLRLLKEKQEREEKTKHHTTVVSPPHSGHAHIRSPPPIMEETSLCDEPPSSSTSSDLPLLQRILALKTKEEKPETKPKTGVGGLLSNMKGKSSSQPTSPTPSTTPTAQAFGSSSRASFSGPAKSALASVPVKLLNNKISFRDRLKLATSAKEKDSSIKDALLKDTEPPAVLESTSLGTTNKSMLPHVPFPLPSKSEITTIVTSTSTSSVFVDINKNSENTSVNKDKFNIISSSSDVNINTSYSATSSLSVNAISSQTNRSDDKRRLSAPPASATNERHNTNLHDNRRRLSKKCGSLDKNGTRWSKLKKAAISKDLTPESTGSYYKEDKDYGKNGKDSEECTDMAVKKPNLFLSRKTKHYRFIKSKLYKKAVQSLPTLREVQPSDSHNDSLNPSNRYRSIDDLSPEYGPLPFVKKLKILNERQKLEELEIAMKTRSFSLDIPESISESSDTLTRSHSEGSSVHQEQFRHIDPQFLTAPLTSSPLHSSNESNETPERRNLKSILKKLSEDKMTVKPEEIPKEVVVPQEIVKKPEKSDSTEFRRLLRAPTIEGYAARHSKLTKSVTFNRDTLQSPPNSANAILINQSPNLFQFGNIPTDNGIDININIKEEGSINEIDRINDTQLVSNKQSNQFKLIKASLEEEQNYFAEILIAIKQIMGGHLHEMQKKYQERLETLEDEVRTKDEIIDQLRNHIAELEKNNTDGSLSDSIDTIISRDRHSWEEPTHEETEELQELPQPINAHAWQRSNNNVVLEMESTDTDSDIGEVSETEPTDYESSDQYENSSSNWEIELLAAQMRERRAGSLDQTMNRPPLRKRLSRGSSMDHQNDKNSE